MILFATLSAQDLIVEWINRLWVWVRDLSKMVGSVLDLFADSPPPGDSEMSLRSSSQAANCHPSTTLGGSSSHYPFNAERQAVNINFLVLDYTRHRNRSRSLPHERQALCG